MRKEIINRIKCEDESVRIEIFCNRQYKGYYVRGHIDTIQDSGSVHDLMRGLFGSINYRFIITVLVSGKYQERIKRGKIRSFQRDVGFERWNTENMFAWTTQKEYVDGRKRWLLAISREWSNSRTYDRHIPEWQEEAFRNESLVIDLDEAGITENSYLEESVRAKKDIILLDMDFFVDEIKLTNGRQMRPYYDRIYTIPAFWCPIRTKELTMWDFSYWFDDLYEILYSNLGYDYLKKREYNTILESVGNLGYEWLRKNTVNKRYLKRLSRISGETGDRTYPLTNFCWKFLDDLIDDLTSQKQIVQCQFCRDFFIYQRRWPTKKFCSLRFEGKNCRKDYNNSLYYRRHLEELKLKAREYQRKRRAEKKEHDRLKAEKKK